MLETLRAIDKQEAMIEMRLAGLSTRRIDDVSEALWSVSASASTAPDLNEKPFEPNERWRGRPLERACSCACVDGIRLKRARDGAHGNVAVMVAIDINDNGYRKVIGTAEGFTQSAEVLARAPLVAEVARASWREDVHRRHNAATVRQVERPPGQPVSNLRLREEQESGTSGY